MSEQKVVNFGEKAIISNERAKKLDMEKCNRIRLELFKLGYLRKNGFMISLDSFFDWAGINPTNEYRNNFVKRVFRNGKFPFIQASHQNDFDAHFIVYKVNRHFEYYLSSRGFKLLLLSLARESTIEPYVLLHFVLAEEDYLRSLSQPEDVNKTELNDLEKRFLTINTKLLENEEELDKQIEKNLKLELELEKYKEYEEVFKKDAFMLNNDERYFTYMYLLKTRCFKAGIYEIDERMYIQKYRSKPIKNPKYVLIDFVYILDKKHYEKIRTVLNSDKKGFMDTTAEEIISVSGSIIQERLYEFLNN